MKKTMAGNGICNPIPINDIQFHLAENLHMVVTPYLFARVYDRPLRNGKDGRWVSTFYNFVRQNFHNFQTGGN
jgi:hypothetical protein